MPTAPRTDHPSKPHETVNCLPAATTVLNESEGFDTDEALTALWYHIARVEALICAAGHTLEFLPGGNDRESRRATERVHTLVNAAAEAALTALDEVEEQMRRLTSQPALQATPATAGEQRSAAEDTLQHDP